MSAFACTPSSSLACAHRASYIHAPSASLVSKPNRKNSPVSARQNGWPS